MVEYSISNYFEFKSDAFVCDLRHYFMQDGIYTPKDVKSLNRAREKRIKGLNHTQQDSIKLSFYEDLVLSVAIRRKYELRPEAFETLKIIYLNPSITAYAIHALQLNTHTAVQARLWLLLRKGLIERFSGGHQQSYLYVVTPLFLNELKTILVP